MHNDFIKLSQTFDHDLPRIGQHGYLQYDLDTHQISRQGQSPLHHEGSYSRKITLSVKDRTLTIDGNMAAYGQIDNLYASETLSEVVQKTNRLLKIINTDLPLFTKGTQVNFLQEGEDGKKVKKITNGCEFHRLDLTSNMSVGPGNQVDYIRAVSTQRYRNSVPNLYFNQRTCDWKSLLGNVNLIYAKVYDKAYDLKTKLLPRVERRYGVNSSEYKYVKRLIEFCEDLGIVRFEQELKRRYLQDNNLHCYGLFEESQLISIHDEFLNINNRFQVEKMDLENISQQLLSMGICKNVKAANTTTMYALQWGMGQTFDFNKSQAREHRARLKKIGIDIANPCDLSKFTPVKAVSSKTIYLQDVQKPEWYRDGQVLKAVS